MLIDNGHPGRSPGPVRPVRSNRTGACPGPDPSRLRGSVLWHWRIPWGFLQAAGQPVQRDAANSADRVLGLVPAGLFVTPRQPGTDARIGIRPTVGSLHPDERCGCAVPGVPLKVKEVRRGPTRGRRRSRRVAAEPRMGCRPGNGARPCGVRRIAGRLSTYPSLVAVISSLPAPPRSQLLSRANMVLGQGPNGCPKGAWSGGAAENGSVVACSNRGVRVSLGILG